jgi:hypothetical protein
LLREHSRAAIGWIAVYRKKKKKEKEQTMNHKTIHRKLKTEQHEPYKKQEVNLGGKLIISFSTRCIPCVSLVTNLMISHE